MMTRRASSCWFWLLLAQGVTQARRQAWGRRIPPAFASTLARTKVQGQPPYNIAGVDLSQKWIQLVQNSKVMATVKIQTLDGEEVAVRYGVRLMRREDGTYRCQEFVEEQQPTNNKLVQQINSTLASLQCKGASSSSIKYVLDGDFCAQLQLVRTLRPPPSPGFLHSTTSIPPPYDSALDSFVTGPLRLELRPQVATMRLPELDTPWDVFHNVSPADTRGHFLLLPTLKLKDKNWRGQCLTNQDCHDLMYLACSIQPTGTILLSFNSVGAGASQNHIHCHLWPSPPVPLMKHTAESYKEVHGWDCYAISKTRAIDSLNLQKVAISFLDYPVFCAKLSAARSQLDQLGQALAVTIQTIGDAPYNIGILNRDHDDEPSVDAYVFVRSKERSYLLPSLKLGASEMMGVFHAQSTAELQQLQPENNTDQCPMAQALEDISYKPKKKMWQTIKAQLIKQSGNQ